VLAGQRQQTTLVLVLVLVLVLQICTVYEQAVGQHHSQTAAKVQQVVQHE
jgi:hypothetical protein